MPTSKNGSKQRSKRNKMSPVVPCSHLRCRRVFRIQMDTRLDDARICRLRNRSDERLTRGGGPIRSGAPHRRLYVRTFAATSKRGVQRLLTGNGIDNGYAFEIAGCQAPDARRPNSAYYTSARPLHPGQPAFCSDESGTLKAEYSGSVEKCRANGLPL